MSTLIDELDDVGDRTLGVGGAVANLVNGIVGAGIVTLPYAFARAGAVMSMSIIVGFAVVNCFSIYILLEATKLLFPSEFSFTAVAFAAAGRWGERVAKVCMLVRNFAGSVAYIRILGDFGVTCLEFVGAPDWVANQSLVTLIIVVCIVAPLCHLRNIAALAKFSLLAIIIYGFFVLCVVIRYISPYKTQKHAGELHSFPKDYQFLPAMSIMAFAYTIQSVVHMIFVELKNPTAKRMTQVNVASLAVTCVAYAVVGMVGYATFGDCVADNILNSYETQDLFMNIVRIVFGFSLTLTLPISIYATRVSIHLLLFSEREGKMHTHHHSFATAMIISAGAVLALVVPGIGVIFDLSGSIIVPIVAFIAPAWCFLQATKKNNTLRRVYIKSRSCAWVMLYLGVFFIIASTGAFFMTVAKGEPKNPACDVDANKHTA